LLLFVQGRLALELDEVLQICLPQAVDNHLVVLDRAHRSCYKAGPWGIESLVERMYGRAAAIDGLVNALNGYDIAGGMPQVIYEAGLLEKMATRHGPPEGATLH
jgi:hypothetical protein